MTPTATPAVHVTQDLGFSDLRLLWFLLILDCSLLGTLDLDVQFCLSSLDLRIETDVLLMQASLEGEVTVEGQETTCPG